MTFSSLGLSLKVVQAINDKGYTHPTEVQSQVIPVAISDRDLIAVAPTGTGKTAAYALPMLHSFTAKTVPGRKCIRGLVLVPTRELAMQIEEDICAYGRYLDLRSLAVVGGVELDLQRQQLIYGVDIVVATPGRLLDLIYQRIVKLDALQVLVLDEADRMLDMGFIGDINKIIDRLPLARQNLLFSATISKSIRGLMNAVLRHPLEIIVEAGNDTSPKIVQWLVAVDKSNKSSLLSYLIKAKVWRQALVFIRTQHGAAKLVSQLEKRGILAESIHGGRSQASRSQILSGFKSGKIAILVATGVAARGIDIDDLERVVNYDLPDDADEYIHRIGRTGRAGASGEAISLVSYDDFKRLCAIERRMDEVITRETFEGFPVKKDLPESNLDFFKTGPAAQAQHSTRGKQKEHK